LEYGVALSAEMQMLKHRKREFEKYDDLKLRKEKTS